MVQWCEHSPSTKLCDPASIHGLSVTCGLNSFIHFLNFMLAFWAKLLEAWLAQTIG